MMGTVRRVAVDRALASTHLPGWDYADAYEIAVSGTAPDSARAAADCLFDLSPIGRMTLRARDVLVRAASLKPAVTDSRDLFPLLHLTADLAVLGLDDRHLEFRVLVGLAPEHVRCTTVVRRHNALGHAYLAVVTPFHRVAVPQMLWRADRRGWRTHRAGPPDDPTHVPRRSDIRRSAAADPPDSRGAPPGR